MVFLLVKGFRVVGPFLTALGSRLALLLLRVTLFVAVVVAVLFREDDLVAVFDWSMTGGLSKVLVTARHAHGWLIRSCHSHAVI
jgi:hypothetical protein